MSQLLLESFGIFQENILFIAGSLPGIFQSDYTAVALGTAGILFSVMDNFNQQLAGVVEDGIEFVYEKALWTALEFLGVVFLALFALSTYDLINDASYTQKSWDYMGHSLQKGVMFSILIPILILLLGLITKIAGKGDTLAGLGLLLTGTVFYFEMLDPIPESRQTLFFGALTAVSFLIVITGEAKGKRIGRLTAENKDIQGQFDSYKKRTRASRKKKQRKGK